jgi:hypothetical protein
MNRKFVRLLTIIGFVLGAWSFSAALAGTVTIDPNSYAPGTDISTATPGVTLDYLQTAPNNGIPPFSPAILGPIYSVACPGSPVDSFNCVNPFGGEVFGHASGPNQPDFVFSPTPEMGAGADLAASISPTAVARTSAILPRFERILRLPPTPFPLSRQIAAALTAIKSSSLPTTRRSIK